MKYLILCGGRGERFQSSKPKPLNRVCGRMIGEWLVETLTKYGISELYWILNPILFDYDITLEIEKWSRGLIKNHFIKLPFETRDPSETLEIALQSFQEEEDSILCIDNDNMYIEGLDKFQGLSDCNTAILVKQIEGDMNPRYGFVKVKNGWIVEGREKKIGWGENAYSCGAYWFRSIIETKNWLEKQRKEAERSGEKSLLGLSMKMKDKCKPILVKNWFSIGTPQDCALAEENHSKYFGWHRTKIVVDLDNTLVSFPHKHGDYSTVSEKSAITDWIRHVSGKGAEIIVNTARRMETHRSNVGKVIADVGITTLNTIKNLNIDESEILFGKPNGDFYLDDKSINPETKDWKSVAGDYQFQPMIKPMNALPVTRKVTLQVKPVEHVFKQGSKEELQGQVYYYNHMNGQSLEYLFPKCYEAKDELLELQLIRGVPASLIWVHNQFSESEWNLICSALHSLHENPTPESLMPCEFQSMYLEKCKLRVDNCSIFKNVDKDLVMWEKICELTKDYKVEKITTIHGDFFMGNIIFPMTGGIKLIDMRGKVGDKLTTSGDPNYDWAKLMMSFLGFDSIVYNLPERSIEDGLEYITRIENYKAIISLSMLLMYSTLPFYSEEIGFKLIYQLKKIYTLFNEPF